MTGSTSAGAAESYKLKNTHDPTSSTNHTEYLTEKGENGLGGEESSSEDLVDSTEKIVETEIQESIVQYS